MYICTVKNSIQNTPIVELHGNCLFVSDAHFRTPPDEASMDRELKLVQLFKNQEDKLQHIFFLGDIFDYWFEYRDVVPKGYVTLFACLKEFHAQGTQIHYFTGNHDMWVEDYFAQTFGATVYHEARLVDINGHRCFVGHGDGLGGKQRKYLFIKRILNCRFNWWLYGMLHPRQSFAIARLCSRMSRNSHDENTFVFKGEKEAQVRFAREMLQTTDVEYFIFAHRHIPTRYELASGHLFFNTGDWLENFSYISFAPKDSEPVLNEKVM